jgi:hypothetical protein
LDCGFVFGSVGLKDTGKDGDQIGWGVEDFGNAARNGALPVGADDEIEAGLGAVLLSDVAERIGASIRDLISEESTTEIWT